MFKTFLLSFAAWSTVWEEAVSFAGRSRGPWLWLSTSVSVCFLWHCSVIHTSQGVALQRRAGCAHYSCSWYPSIVPALHRQGQGLFLFSPHGLKPVALHQGLCSLVLMWLLQSCGSRGSVTGYGTPSTLVSCVRCGSGCMCVSVPSVRNVRIH